jgi:hypothetical protein
MKLTRSTKKGAKAFTPSLLRLPTELRQKIIGHVIEDRKNRPLSPFHGGFAICLIDELPLPVPKRTGLIATIVKLFRAKKKTQPDVFYKNAGDFLIGLLLISKTRTYLCLCNFCRKHCS